MARFLITPGALHTLQNLVKQCNGPALPVLASARGLSSQAAAVDTSSSKAGPGTTPLPAAAFSDHKAIYSSQSASELLRSWLVFRLCGMPAFVKHADSLLSVARATLGNKLTLAIVKHTFFAHFCAGETDEEVQAKARQLQSLGVGSILDYAAEDDVKPDKEQKQKRTQTQKQQAEGKQAQQTTGPAAGIGTSTSTPPPGGGATVSEASGAPVLKASPAVARQYSYLDESLCDAHVATFLSCIQSASTMPGQGFAAVKLTALGNPRLLERVSSAIQEVRGLFKQWDTDGSGFVERGEFNAGYQALLPDATEAERTRIFTWMDNQHQNKFDYVSWCQRLSLSRMPEYAARIKDLQQGSEGTATPSTELWRDSLHAAALTPHEVELVQACRARLVKLAEAAAEQRVKLMVDAEHTYMQPAIDHLTMELMRKYNRNGRVVIYNTYQAYLKDTHARLVIDWERARREGYTLGVKLVRGAYLGMERARAAQLGYPSPVWDTLDETHACYNSCMEDLLQKVKDGRAEVLFGTHNQGSVEQAVALMADLGLKPATSPVYFGQLLGMSDHLTQVLGAAGYNAYKYVPYGRVEQVIPYLLRRATENSTIMKGTKRDLALLGAELGRRMRASLRLEHQ